MLSERVQVALAACLDDLGQDKSRKLFNTEVAQKSVTKAINHRLVSLLAHNALQHNTAERWRGTLLNNILEAQGEEGVCFLLVRGMDFFVSCTFTLAMLPIIALLPPLEPKLAELLSHRWLADVPCIKFIVFAVADIAFCITITMPNVMEDRSTVRLTAEKSSLRRRGTLATQQMRVWSLFRLPCAVGGPTPWLVHVRLPLACTRPPPSCRSMPAR